MNNVRSLVPADRMVDARRLAEILAENEMLRAEVKVARQAMEISAELTVAQFVETEKLIKKVQMANALQKAVFDAAHRISVIATDENGVIRLFNAGAEKMLGYSASEVVGTQTPVIFHLQSEYDLRCQEMSERAERSISGIELFFEHVRQGIFKEREWTYVRKDGTKFPAELSVTGLYGPENEVVGFLCAATDIAERKKKEQEILEARRAAEESNRAKSAFLANMSHELRTPLNAIIGYSEMLQEDAEDEGQEDFIPDLKKIHAAGKHLLSLINDILDLSKIEAGKVELLIEPFDLPDLVKEVVSTVQPLVEKKYNTLKASCAEEIGTVTGDITRMRQILFNLISNAAKFTENGEISMTVLPEVKEGRKWISVSVSDTGIGMTPEQARGIFEPFTQADSSTTKQYGGTGLGLTISKRFCEMMGGSIQVESEQGKGTTFIVMIPAVVKSAKTKQERPKAEEPLPAIPVTDERGSPNTVLVIDDDPTARDLMSRFMEKEGFKVVCAPGAKEGIELAGKIKPAMITLDVLMPGMDGWAALKHLKSDPDLADIPVVMVSMLDEEDMGFALGASEYLVKPVDRNRLAAVLGKYMVAGATGRALVVDDQKDARELMAKMLQGEGWGCIQAENGEVALRRIAEDPPDLVFLDLMMPVMDGFQFIETLRKRDDLPPVPIIVITAKEITQEEREYLNSNVQKVIQKSELDRDRVLEELKTMIDKQVSLEKG